MVTIEVPVRLRGVATVGIALLAACGSGDSSAPPCTVSLQDEVARVQVLPAAATIIPGEQVQFGATAYSCTGDPLLSTDFTWQTADGSTLSITPTGLAQGVKAGGPVGVTATASGKVGSARVTINPRTVVSVRIEPATAVVAVGQTSTLVAKALDSQGQELPGFTPAWSTSDPSRATVTQAGVVSAIATGAVDVMATIEGRTGTSAVTVVAVAVATIAVSPAAPSLAGGATLQLTAVLKDDEGNVLTGRVITWTTSNPARAVVSSSGLVSGRGNLGPVTITATAEGKSGSTEVSITQAPPASLSFVTQPGTIIAGGTFPDFQVEVLDALGLRATGSTATITIDIDENQMMPGELHGTLSATAVNGVATFTGLSMTRATGLYLIAKSDGLMWARSAVAWVNPGPPVSLGFISQPPNAVVHEIISNPFPTVWCKDVYDNWASTCVTVSIALGNNPAGATLLGPTTDSPGGNFTYVTFDRLRIDRVGSGYTFVATATGLGSATSEAFSVSAGPAVRMAYLEQPSDIVSGTAFNPAIVIELQDYYGNRVLNTTTEYVTLFPRGPGDIAPPAGTSIAGSQAEYFVQGLATFSSTSVIVFVDRTLTLRAVSAGMGNLVSQPFVVRLP